MWIVAIWRPKILAALAVGCLLVVATQSARAQAYQFTTVDYPATTGGVSQNTILTGISGSTIIGSATGTGQPGRTAFSYSGGSFATLPIPGASSIFPAGISGETIVGSYDTNSASGHGFELNGSANTTIDDPQATFGTQVDGVYKNTVVGLYSDGQGVHGFSYESGVFTAIADPLSPYTTIAWGISGTNITGSYENNGYHGFVYDGSTYTTIDDPLAAFPSTGAGGTRAFGISGNNIVGDYYDSIGMSNGFIYDGSTYTTLDDPSAVEGTFPIGIDGDTIVGYYVDGNGDSHGFIATALPEPGPILLLVCGALVLLRRRRKHCLINQ